MSDEKDILFTSASTVAKSTVRKSRTYGSTSKSTSTTAPKTKFHKVRPSDSLVSLAIKYETSVEELKRLNGLWSNDGLQLKSNIRVPESSSAGSSSAASSRNPTPTGTGSSGAALVSLEQFVSEDDGEPATLDPPPVAAAASSTAKQPTKSTASVSVSRSKTFTNERDFSEMDTGEFLRKFDLQFMQLKTNVEKLENESSLSEEDTAAAYSCMPARRTARYMHSRQALRPGPIAPPAVGVTAVVDSARDILANPELVVRSQQTLPTSSEVEETFYKL